MAVVSPRGRTLPAPRGVVDRDVQSQHNRSQRREARRLEQFESQLPLEGINRLAAKLEGIFDRAVLGRYTSEGNAGTFYKHDFTKVDQELSRIADSLAKITITIKPGEENEFQENFANFARKAKQQLIALGSFTTDKRKVKGETGLEHNIAITGLDYDVFAEHSARKVAIHRSLEPIRQEANKVWQELNRISGDLHSQDYMQLTKLREPLRRKARVIQPELEERPARTNENRLPKILRVKTHTQKIARLMRNVNAKEITATEAIAVLKKDRQEYLEARGNQTETFRDRKIATAYELGFKYLKRDKSALYRFEANYTGPRGFLEGIDRVGRKLMDPRKLRTARKPQPLPKVA